MSWDIIVQDLPRDVASIKEIPNGFQPGPIGSRATVIEVIKDIAPFADFSDPAWGIIDGPGFSIEVSLGEAETLQSFSFHIRGSDEAAGLVADVLNALGLRALDTSLGDFFRPEKAVESLRKWRAYRDHAVSKWQAT